MIAQNVFHILAGGATATDPSDAIPSSSEYEGFHDETDCRSIKGWAFDKLHPNEPVKVELYNGDTLIAAVTGTLRQLFTRVRCVTGQTLLVLNQEFIWSNDKKQPILLMFVLLSIAIAARAQTTEFTYQGSLSIGSPPAPVSFSVNGTNAAKNTVATFTQAGGYSFRVTISNGTNSTTSGSPYSCRQSARSAPCPGQARQQAR